MEEHNNLLLTINLPMYFCPEIVVCLLHPLHIIKCTTDYVIMDANMNPDQTGPAREQSDLGPYCLQYWLPKYISRWESR